MSDEADRKRLRVALDIPAGTWCGRCEQNRIYRKPTGCFARFPRKRNETDSIPLTECDEVEWLCASHGAQAEEEERRRRSERREELLRRRAEVMRRREEELRERMARENKDILAVARESQDEADRLMAEVQNLGAGVA